MIVLILMCCVVLLFDAVFRVRTHHFSAVHREIPQRQISKPLQVEFLFTTPTFEIVASRNGILEN